MKPTDDCVCDCTVPVCPKCGRKWDFAVGDGLYTSREVMEKGRGLYGAKFVASWVAVDRGPVRKAKRHAR